MNQITVHDRITTDALRQIGAQYFRAEKVYTSFYRNGRGDSLYITDLTNAGKAGAECVTVKFEDIDAGKLDVFALTRLPLTLLEIFRDAVARVQDGAYQGVVKQYGAGTALESRGIQVNAYTKKGVRTFSPFVEAKPLADRPKKWGLPHVVRALLAGQAEPVCNYSFTDDYAYDASVNNQTGTKPGALAMARELVESPSGWHAWESSREAGNITICCHSFLSYDLKLSI